MKRRKNNNSVHSHFYLKSNKMQTAYAGTIPNIVLIAYSEKNVLIVSIF